MHEQMKFHEVEPHRQATGSDAGADEGLDGDVRAAPGRVGGGAHLDVLHPAADLELHLLVF